MKKALLSLVTIAAVTGLVVGASRAYFTDVATSQDNEFTAGELDVQLNDIETDEAGPSLRGLNMYPGTFVQASGIINNTGDVSLNPGIALANGNDNGGLLPYIWLQIWTNGKLWYSDWLDEAPGYTSSQIVLDTLAPGEGVSVSYRMLLDETAPNSVAGGSYSVDTVITGYQANSPDGQTTTPKDTGSQYQSIGWSISVCGNQWENPTYYSYNQPGWDWNDTSGNTWPITTETNAPNGWFAVGEETEGFYCKMLK